MSDRADELLFGAAFIGACLGLPTVTALGWGFGLGIEWALGLDDWRNPIWLVTIVLGFVIGPSIGAWLAIAARRRPQALETGMFLLLTWGAISILTISIVSLVLEKPARHPLSLVPLSLALAVSVVAARWLALRREKSARAA